MINKENGPVLLGIGAIIVTLAMGTCSTNGRIDDVNRRMDDGFNNINRRMDDGFNNVNQRIDDTNQRIDDTNQRIDDTNQRIDEVQSDIREIRTMLFETLKDQNRAN